MKQQWGWADHAKVTLAAFCAYFLSFLVVLYFVQPLQDYIFPQLGHWASLVFLAHGVRVFFIWLYGARGIIPLFIAQLITGLILFNPDPGLQLNDYVQASLVGALAPWLAFEIFRLSGRSFYARDNNRVNWRILILIGFVSSIFNSIGNSLAYVEHMRPENQLYNVITYTTGDTLGTIAILFILVFVRRYILHARAWRGSTL